MTTAVLLLIGTAASLLLLLQAYMWLQSRRTLGRPAPDTASVDGEATADRVRVYYFYAAHCGPCRAVTPLVERLRASHRNLIKLDIAEARELAQAFGVAATPSFIQVVDGVIRRVKLGGQSEARLRAMLQLPPRA
jgi:thioredoxin 1